MTRSQAMQDRRVPDPEVWDAPERLTDDDLNAHGGVDLRRERRRPDDLEDDQ